MQIFGSTRKENGYTKHILLKALYFVKPRHCWQRAKQIQAKSLSYSPKRTLKAPQFLKIYWLFKKLWLTLSLYQVNIFKACALTGESFKALQ
ncbi:MAG: hypothetical protein GX345_08080 [Clostridiales bacterium]|nr:hypothetical protein [Clostridiales bacterium]